MADQVTVLFDRVDNKQSDENCVKRGIWLLLTSSKNFCVSVDVSTLRSFPRTVEKKDWSVWSCLLNPTTSGCKSCRISAVAEWDLAAHSDDSSSIFASKFSIFSLPSITTYNTHDSSTVKTTVPHVSSAWMSCNLIWMEWMSEIHSGFHSSLGSMTH